MVSERFHFCPSCGQEIHGLNQLRRLDGLTGCQNCELEMAKQFMAIEKSAPRPKTARMPGGHCCYIR